MPRQPKPTAAEPTPPITEAERNLASEIFTAAADEMVALGYGRFIWGNVNGGFQRFFIVALRAHARRLQKAKPTTE